MNSLRKILTVARYEFTTTLTRKAFLLVAFGMPLLIAGGMALGALITSHQLKGNQIRPIAIVDQANIIKPELLTVPSSKKQQPEGEELKQVQQSNHRFVRYTALDEALAALLKGEVTVCYLLDQDYPATGKITSFVRESQFPSGPPPLVKEQLVDQIRASLLDERITGQVRNRILDRPQFQNREVSPQGQIKSAPSAQQKFFSIVGPIFFVLLLTLSIFTSSSYLLQSLAAEKQNRVIEVLLSSVEHEELLAGKILGLGLIGLLQSGVYAVLIGYPLFPFLGSGGWATLLLSPIYVILGYLFFASLMVATGIFLSGEQEASQLAGIWMLIILAPSCFLALSPGLDSWIAKAFSYFPLTAPVTMLLRLSWAKTGAVDVLLSVGAMIIGIYLAVHYAARIFRLASLMHGKPPSLPEFLRVMRSA